MPGTSSPPVPQSLGLTVSQGAGNAKKSMTQIQDSKTSVPKKKNILTKVGREK